MRKMKSKKLKAILSITGYFLLIIALCVSASVVFHNLYYELIYISGNSMYPTLKGSSVSSTSLDVEIDEDGSTADFGIVDTHKSAINRIKRFSIVSTYYSDDYDENGALTGNNKQKIKRIIAMPNETFKIEDSKLYVQIDGEFEYIPYTFEIEQPTGYIGKDVFEYTLGEDEYWVLGDHRDKSRDSGSLHEPIKKDYIIGVLVAIEGQAQLKLKQATCTNCGKSYKSGDYCSNCGSPLQKEFDLVNKQYHWPKYF